MERHGTFFHRREQGRGVKEMYLHFFRYTHKIYISIFFLYMVYINLTIEIYNTRINNETDFFFYIRLQWQNFFYATITYYIIIYE